jgi:hypothetical protein
MGFTFDPGALLGQSFSLDEGPRVRLRLARLRDRPAITALLERQGQSADELALARLVRVDPRERVVICACALLGSVEELIGIGAIDVGRRDPGPVLVDDRAPSGLEELLRSSLVGRANALSQARAS